MTKVIPKIALWLKQNYVLVGLALISGCLRFFYFSQPHELVFDEIYFGKFVINYFSSTNYFDIHPPLGKLLIFFWAKIFGFHYLENQEAITLLSDPKNLFILRLVPAVFGTLLIPLVFKFVEILTHSKKISLFAAFFILFDNAYLTYSRYLFLDIVLVFFGILALYLFFVCIKKMSLPLYEKPKKLITSLIFTSLALGATFSIKWTGLAIWGIVIASLIWYALKRKIVFKYAIFALITFIIIPAIFYFVTFALHFTLLKESGPDDGFFSPEYLKTLKNNNLPETIKPLSLFGKFKEINKIMYTSNVNLTATHPYSSKWWQWPFSKKPIYLWQKTSSSHLEDKKTSNLWLFGNLFSWLGGFLAILISLIFGGVEKFFKIIKKEKYQTFKKQFSQLNFSLLYWLSFAYLANLLPFIFIKRVMFLYHYFFAALFAQIALAILFEKISIFFPKCKIFLYLFCALVLIFFILFSPLSYGFPEPTKLYDFQLKIIY